MLFRSLIDEESAIVSIYYGEEISKESAEKIGSRIEEEHPEVEVEIHYGGQPIYYYVVSVE